MALPLPQRCSQQNLAACLTDLGRLVVRDVVVEGLVDPAPIVAVGGAALPVKDAVAAATTTTVCLSCQGGDWMTTRGEAPEAKIR